MHDESAVGLVESKGTKRKKTLNQYSIRQQGRGSAEP